MYSIKITPVLFSISLVLGGIFSKEVRAQAACRVSITNNVNYASNPLDPVIWHGQFSSRNGIQDFQVMDELGFLSLSVILSRWDNRLGSGAGVQLPVDDLMLMSRMLEERTIPVLKNVMRACPPTISSAEEACIAEVDTGRFRCELSNCAMTTDMLRFAIKLAASVRRWRSGEKLKAGELDQVFGDHMRKLPSAWKVSYVDDIFKPNSPLALCNERQAGPFLGVFACLYSQETTDVRNAMCSGITYVERSVVTTPYRQGVTAQ